MKEQSAKGSGRASPAQREAASQPARLLLTAPQAAEWIGVSERFFHTMRAAGQVPPPVVLGPRCLRWIRDELAAAVLALPRQDEPAPEPPQLRRRIDALKSGRG